MLVLVLVDLIPYFHKVLVVIEEPMFVSSDLFLNELLSVVLNQHLVR